MTQCAMSGDFDVLYSAGCRIHELVFWLLQTSVVRAICYGCTFKVMHVNRWRNFFIYMLMGVLCAFAIRNVVSYKEKFAVKRIRAENASSLIQSALVSVDADDSEERRQLAARLQLYSLLDSLGNDRLLHEEIRFGVVVRDPDFYRGRYIDKPSDTILKACAIQPFSVPALTRMPLLSPFAPEFETCRYESYGYQYLAVRHPDMGGDKANPCELAKARGFSHLVVIEKDADVFVERRLSCAEK